MKGTFREVGWRIALALAVGAASTSPSSARAAAPPAEAPTEMVARERPATRSFYGWQILATGEAGGVVAAASAVLPDSPLGTLPATMGFLVGMPFYALGGPATHWTHGDFDKGLISLAGNFALPIVGGFVGQAIGCAPSDASENCGTRGFLTGFAIALVTVPLVDALVLGWEDIPDDDPAVNVGPPEGSGRAAMSSTPARKRAAHFKMVPAWSFSPHGVLAFGVAGRF